jgi:tRNA 2-thiouridine synthesizing protein A
MKIGDVVAILADDPAAAIDIPHFCNETGHTLISQKATGSRATEYKVRKEI